jgi:O-acetyl-ADP-ribose deacetylase (regulator of RNase III)
MKIEVVEGDITLLPVDAIVNAANHALLGGGGVDGAIHRAAGPGLREECEALPARWVIHTVGPVWHGGHQGEPGLLAACYRNAMSLAAVHGIDSIAFPAISCGVFGYPVELAVPLAVRTVRAWEGARPARVVFSCFDPGMAARYRAMLALA